MKRLAPLFTLAALAVLAACGDTRPTTSPRGTPNRDISDGANFGNPHFFFLPPMVKNPFGSLGFTAGTFNPNIATKIQICQFDGTSCGPIVRTFMPSDITVSASSGSYSVNWDTKADNVIEGDTYRIFVLVTLGGTDVQLGYADVLAVANMAEFKNMQTSDIIGLVDGRTLPIAYRVDLGAMSYALGQAGLPGGCTNASDCAEAVIGNQSPTGSFVVTTNTGFAGGEFFNGWLPAAFADQQVLVTIERVNVLGSGPCHAETFTQFEGCYHYQTTPDVGPFALPVTVGLCVTVPETSPLYDHLELFSSRRPTNGDDRGEPLTVLADATPSFLPTSKCEGFGPSVQPTDTRIGATPSRMLHLAAAGLRNAASALSAFFGPKPLYAIHLGLGGVADGFSNIGWGLAPTLLKTGGDGQSGVIGSTLPTALSVHASSAHNDNVDPIGLGGVGVTFTITNGGGTLTSGTSSSTSLTVLTDASGNASVSLALPGNAGPVTVVASAPTATPVTFTEQATAVGLGTIQGTVRDASGAVLPGVTVSAVNAATGASVSAITNATGQYVIGGLVAGSYNVVAGFPNYIFTNPTTVVNGGTSTVDITGSVLPATIG